MDPGDTVTSAALLSLCTVNPNSMLAADLDVAILHLLEEKHHTFDVSGGSRKGVQSATQSTEQCHAAVRTRP